MTDDREMLEYAAKAAGITGKYGHAPDDYYYKGNTEGILTTLPDGQLYVWNPLTDNNDAFRLAARLKIQVAFGTFKDNVASAYKFGTPAVEVENTDIEAAAREAIFLMAVDIGKGMK